MIIKKTKTIVGLDFSINGTGFAVLSDAPELKKKGEGIAHTRYALIEAGVVRGTRLQKTPQTVYQLERWGKEGVKCDPAIPGVPLYLRAHTVFHEFIKPLLSYCPQAIIIEGYSFGSKGLVFDIAEFTGQLKYLIELHYLNSGEKAPFVIVPPTNLKFYTTGKGQADKEAMMASLERKYKINFYDNNIADAFSLAIMGAELGEKISDFSKKGSFKDLKNYKRDLEKAS